jgi:hypothetical protein
MVLLVCSSGSLRHIGVTVGLANCLIASFRRTGDEKMLELIARTPNVVADIDAEFLLDNLSEDYWRVRVLEVLLLAAPQRGVKQAVDYPKEFIWALGRAKADSYAPLMERIVDVNRYDIGILSIYAWALGRLRAERELERLIDHIQQTWPNEQAADLPVGVACDNGRPDRQAGTAGGATMLPPDWGNKTPSMLRRSRAGSSVQFGPRALCFDDDQGETKGPAPGQPAAEPRVDILDQRPIGKPV